MLYNYKFTIPSILNRIGFKKWILTLFTGFCFLVSFAQLQQDIQTPKIVPPSPDAAALGKYGQIPVDKSTGIPDISVPIYEITKKPLDLAYRSLFLTMLLE